MHWSILFYVIYLGIPLVLLLFFGLYKPKLAPLTALICSAADLLVYWPEFLYYESRGILLLFMGLQLTFIAAACLTLRLKGRKR